MDPATLIGICSAFALVILSIMMGSGIGLFIDLPSAMIVLGGTLGATMIHYPLKDVMGVFKAARKVFLPFALNPAAVVEVFVDLSKSARKEGILALEKEIWRLDDEFFVKGLQLAVDGMDPESIREILETEVDYLQERHKTGADIFGTMATFFPSMGMIGTLIGLIQMLKTMEDPSAIGPAMALALITTFYGAVGANLICLPIAGKLRKRSRDELTIKEMIIEGVVALANGENPRIVERKLHSYMPPRSRESRFG